jgi:hypothetical protein
MNFLWVFSLSILFKICFRIIETGISWYKVLVRRYLVFHFFRKFVESLHKINWFKRWRKSWRLNLFEGYQFFHILIILIWNLGFQLNYFSFFFFNYFFQEIYLISWQFLHLIKLNTQSFYFIFKHLHFFILLILEIFIFLFKFCLLFQHHLLKLKIDH